MGTVTGVVEAKTGLGKYGTYGLLVNGKWHNSKFEIKCNKGDEVQFEDGDKNYVNKLKVVSSGGGASVAGSGSGTSAPVRATGARGGFPIGPLDGQRSIIRQNAVTNANNMLATALQHNELIAKKFAKVPNVATVAESLIEAAKMIEAYTTGDADTAEAEAKVKDAKAELEDSM